MQKSPVYMTKLIMAYCTIVVHCAMTSTSVIQIPNTTTPNITEDPKYTTPIGMMTFPFVSSLVYNRCY